MHRFSTKRPTVRAGINSRFSHTNTKLYLLPCWRCTPGVFARLLSPFSSSDPYASSSNSYAITTCQLSLLLSAILTPLQRIVYSLVIPDCIWRLQMSQANLSLCKQQRRLKGLKSCHVSTAPFFCKVKEKINYMWRIALLSPTSSSGSRIWPSAITLHYIKLHTYILYWLSPMELFKDDILNKDNRQYNISCAR